MGFSLAQAEKDDADAREAVRNGIGARLLELGFTRKSARLYVREDERFKEWVRFSYGGSGAFSDLIGIYDKELAALTESCPHSRGADFGVVSPRPAHVLHSAQTAWRNWESACEKDWRETLDWWNPIDWARRTPRRESEASIYVGDRGKWRTNGNPDMCAAESLKIWRKHIEPWRQRMLTCRHFVFGHLIYTTVPLMEDSLVLLNFYVGQIADAERICRRTLSRTPIQAAGLGSDDASGGRADAEKTPDQAHSSRVHDAIRKQERLRHIVSTLGLNA